MNAVAHDDVSCEAMKFYLSNYSGDNLDGEWKSKEEIAVEFETTVDRMKEHINCLEGKR